MLDADRNSNHDSTEEPDPVKKPSADQASQPECDVIMKGGITSGVVYPQAICQLATIYRLRNVGGTSAGAIAAAGAAAAEHGRAALELHAAAVDRAEGGQAEPGRRALPPETGFAGLAGMPDWISGEGNLRGLFHPAPEAKPYHRILMQAIKSRQGPLASGARALSVSGAIAGAAMLSRRGWMCIVGAAPGFLMMLAMRSGATVHDAWRGFLLLAVLCGAIAAIVAILWRLKSPEILPCVPEAERRNIAEEQQLARRHHRRLRLGGGLALIALGLAAIWLTRSATDDITVWGISFAWLIAIVGFFLGSCVAITIGLGDLLSKNFFGLVPGHSKDPGSMALCDWLHAQINLLAGRRPEDDPLTFGDLWEGPKAPKEAAKDPDQETEEDAEEEEDVPEESRSEDRGGDGGCATCDPRVNLEVLTTCLTEGIPYRLPHDLDSSFSFRKSEFERIFPPVVVGYLERVAKKRNESAPSGDEGVNGSVMDRSDGETAGQETSDGDALIPLPSAADLPVVLAIRMSLSFPILISAVPLWKVDYSCPPRGEDGELARDAAKPERSWFSDGGISSNFPITFFDRLLPSRPTFAFNLRGFDPARYDRKKPEESDVWSPTHFGEGIQNPWSRIEAGSGLSQVRSFLGLIKNAMQNWADVQQSLIPGYRERVVHIAHTKDEGGMNLDMPQPVLDALSDRGRRAGERLLDFYFHETPMKTTPTHVSWTNHRRARLRSTLAMLQDALVDVEDAYRHEDYATVLDELSSAGAYRTTKTWVDFAKQLLESEAGQGDDDEGPGGLLGLGARLREADEYAPTRIPSYEAPRPRVWLRTQPAPKRACSLTERLRCLRAGDDGV